MEEGHEADPDSEKKSQCSEAGEVRWEAEALQAGFRVWVCARDRMTERLKFPLFSRDKDWDYSMCFDCEDSKNSGSFPVEVLRGWRELGGHIWVFNWSWKAVVMVGPWTRRCTFVSAVWFCTAPPALETVASLWSRMFRVVRQERERAWSAPSEPETHRDQVIRKRALSIAYTAKIIRPTASNLFRENNCFCNYAQG